MTRIHKSKSLLSRKGKRVYYDSDTKLEDGKRVKEVQISVSSAAPVVVTTPELQEQTVGQVSVTTPGLKEQRPAADQVPGVQEQPSNSAQALQAQGQTLATRQSPGADSNF